MTKRRIILSLMLAWCLAAAAQKPWSAFSDANGDFKAMLPGKPTQTSDSPATFVLSTVSSTYVISYTDAHEGAAWEKTLNAERDSTIPSLDGKILQEKEVSLSGYRGRAYRFEGKMPSGSLQGPIAGELRLYFDGHRFFMLMAVVRAGSTGENISRFLNSFQLLPGSNHPHQ